VIAHKAEDAPGRPLVNATVTFTPFRTENEAVALERFARDALTKLVPGTRSRDWRYLDGTASSEPYDFEASRTAYGTVEKGLTVAARTQHYERSGWNESRYSLNITSHGLPDGASLSIAGSDDEVTFSCIAPGPVAAALEQAFRQRFGAEQR